MKVVILAGGLGTRIMEQSKVKPKPMIEIGDMPILWHIMKGYSYFGYNDFIICAGYKQHIIKEWFYNYFVNTNDIQFDFSNGKNEISILDNKTESWKVSIIDTGYSTMTGGRLKRVEKYINNETFMLTYGDGVCDVDINDLVKFHQSHKKVATLTSVVQSQQKGVLDINMYGAVKSFREKNKNDGAKINAGFMVLEPDIFKYLKDDKTVLEAEPLEQLAKKGELMSYNHTGFWQCMDSLKEQEMLCDMWQRGDAPWKLW